MTAEEITAIAREFAEEIVQDTDSNPELPVCLLNEMRKEVAEDFEKKLHFLLRRYCLVEKEVVRTAYQQAMEQGKHAHLRCQVESRAQFRLLESLFPEIAKEVGNG